MRIGEGIVKRREKKGKGDRKEKETEDQTRIGRSGSLILEGNKSFSILRGQDMGQ